MSMPFYVAPEQFMRDRAEYARRNIARGRNLVAAIYADGIVMCAENPSRRQRKIREIYDRIAFCGVGRYNEFDSLRIAGVRFADLRGYAYSREDVDAQSLANAYAQMLGQAFTHEMKPLEVEILVAELGHEPAGDTLFHILYDGTPVDQDRFAVLPSESDPLQARMEQAWEEGMDLATAVRRSATALAGPDRTLEASDLEIAVLARGDGRRAFRRLGAEELAGYVGERVGGDATGTTDQSGG